MGIYLNPGNKLFQIALNGKIFIDKSRLITETNSLIDTPQRFLCVSRPRRFGKSMAADMLAAYYGRGTDSSPLFDNLQIAEDENYKKYLNQYYVIKLNMQDFLSLSSDVTGLLELLQKKIIRELQRELPDLPDPEETFLSMVLNDVYSMTGVPFIFIIDEWDCILREKKFPREQLNQYLDFLRNLLKDRVYVSLAYMTGILPIKKYGTHSALNMFSELSMIDAGDFAPYFGFTGEEVSALCEEYQVSYEEMAGWYDGYTIGKKDKKKGLPLHIYNPKSVVDSLRNGAFSSYWTRTETYEALRVYIDMDFDGLRDAVKELLGGAEVPVNTEKFQNDMVSLHSRDDILTLLVHLGYLSYNFDDHTVHIPNREVRNEFYNAVDGSHWDELLASIQNSARLLEDTIAGNEKAVAKAIDYCHQQNISAIRYNDENSLSCVITLAYYSAMNNYIRIREMPAGKGFADIVFIPRKGCTGPAMVVELKWDRSAETALRQIHEKRYPDALADYSGNLLLVGISYDRESKEHSCVIEKLQKEA